MHRDVTDEDLGAYLDGALDPRASAEIESVLAESAVLRARLASIERLNGAVRQAAGELEASPARFEDVVNSAFDRREGGNVVDMPRRPSRQRSPWEMPLAAGLLLFVTAGGGFWAGAQFSGGQTGGPSMIARGAPLFTAIDTTVSGATVNVGGEALTPVVSFAAADGRACREVEMEASGQNAVAIVCREADAWRVEVLVAASAPSATGYETVGDASGAAVEQVYARLGGRVMSAEDERALMQRGWRR